MSISGKNVLKKLRKQGWAVVSHVKLKKGTKITIVPVHSNKDLPRGTIKSIEKQTGEQIL